MNETLI